MRPRFELLVSVFHPETRSIFVHIIYLQNKKCHNECFEQKCDQMLERIRVSLCKQKYKQRDFLQKARISIIHRRET